ncbi:MAG: ATP-binding protein [Bacteroidota bacterium]
MEINTHTVTKAKLESLQDVISKLKKSYLENYKTSSKKNNEIDVLLTSLDAIVGDLPIENKAYYNDERINHIMDMLIKYTVMDFSEKLPITTKGDEIDAISLGINTLVEELQHSISTEKTHNLQLENKNRLLIESEERFRILIENVKDYSIIMLDTTGHIISWNKGAEYINGYLENEILGKHISIFYTENEINENEPEQNLTKAKEIGRFESESIRKKKDGSEFWADVVYTALYNEQGALKGYSKITRDINKRKKLELELEQRSKELERSNTELEQFAYVASHDLQEPLRTVTSYVQLLANRYKDKLDQDANDFIDFAVDGSNRMRNLISSLLEYSRVNRIKPFEPINLNEKLKEVLLDLNTTINETHAKIIVNELPEIIGDTVLIGRLFHNLIANALKFKGKKIPEIIISGELKNGEFLFSVKDNGIGIQMEYANKIFILFQQLHGKGKYPGTGIGLSVCKKIVERHKGKIWVNSELNKGSIFYFTINKNLKNTEIETL